MKGPNLRVAVLLPVMLWLAGASAQPLRADSPITINGLACPSDNVIPLDPASGSIDLADNQDANTTYVLLPGAFTLTRPTRVNGKGSVVCYMGNGTTREDVVVDLPSNFSGRFLVDGGTLGLKGMVVDGSAGQMTVPSGYNLVDVVAGGSLTASAVTFQNIRAEMTISLVQSAHVTCTKTRFRALSMVLAVLRCDDSILQLQEVSGCSPGCVACCHVTYAVQHWWSDCRTAGFARTPCYWSSTNLIPCATAPKCSLH
jgi:hypothetical protein